MQLEGKIVVLTGAAGGMGRVIATGLDRAGAKLILADLDARRLNELNDSLGSRHRCVAGDLVAPEHRALLQQACRESGGLDVLINAAGVSQFALVDRISAERLELMLRVNLLVPMLLCQELLPLLRESGDAAIVNLGSTFGAIGYPGFAAYSASKFGLRGYTESLRRELQDTPIRVFYLAPRATLTDMNSSAVVEMNRTLGNTMDPPELVAEALLEMLAGGRGADRFLGWPEKLVARLNAFLPGIVDRALGKQLGTIKHYAEI